MSITVEELKEAMEYLCEQGLGDEQVLFLSQPSWPFYYSISSVAEFDGKILLVENSQEGYGCSFDDIEELCF